MPKKIYDEMQKNDLAQPQRSPKKIAEHINQKLKGKKVVLYAAGKHTVELLEFLDDDINIVAIIDDEPAVDGIGGIKVLHTSSMGTIDFDVVVISSSFFTWYMDARLRKLGVPAGKIKNYYDVKIDKSHYEKYHEQLPPIIRGGKPNLLLIVPFENADHITRFSSVIKERYDLHKLYFLKGENQDRNIHFKQVGCVEHALPMLLKHIHDNRDNIDVIVLNGISSIFHIAYCVKKLFPHIKLVISIMDFLTSLGSKHRIMQELEHARRYDFEKKCEKFMVQHADGFLASMSGKWAKKFLFDRNPNSFQIYNCLSKDIFVNIKKDIADKPLLCYAGGVLPTHINKIISADIKMINVVKPALAHGCAFHMYSSIGTTSNIEEFYPDYLELMAHNQDFKLFSFLPIDELVGQICNADFGVMYYDFSVAKRERILKYHLESVIPTKVFTYMAAGLPILISKELKSTHEFLMDNGVGVSVSQKNINNIKTLVDKADYKKLKINVDKFQNEFCMENKAGDMMNALAKMVSK